MLQVGDRAPDVRLNFADGTSTQLAAALKQHHAILYFFPKDFTPGCTKEACSFRDHRAEIQSLGGEIYGVSLDSVEKHASFAKEYRLTFPLVADEDKAVARAFGVLRLGGFLLTKRVTFVIERGGVIRHVTQSEFNMDVHIDEAIKALKSLSQVGKR